MYASHDRCMIPHLLQALEFHSNNAIHRLLIETGEQQALRKVEITRARQSPAAADTPRDPRWHG
ncbi:MAG: hypothetical protein JO057_12735 [Chloroflexi bacterium]|nr:hypothetical protein [Chloroflexota bacterium]